MREKPTAIARRTENVNGMLAGQNTTAAVAATIQNVIEAQMAGHPIKSLRRAAQKITGVARRIATAAITIELWYSKPHSQPGSRLDPIAAPIVAADNPENTITTSFT